MRLFAITVLAVLAMAAGVLHASNSQRTWAEDHATEAATANAVRYGAALVDASLGAYVLTGDASALTEGRAALGALSGDLARSADAAADDRVEARAVADERTAADRLTRRTRAALDAGTTARVRAALRRDSLTRHELVDAVTEANGRLRDRQLVKAVAEDRAAARTAPLLILALSVLFGAMAGLVGLRDRAVRRRKVRDADRRERFAEAMQVTDHQSEAHGLLKEHLERSLPGAAITVLARNNSADRLEASTALVEASPLATALQQARPRSCMAIRLSRPYAQGSADEVVGCEVCGVSGVPSVCHPLTVGGEVIGSVLAERDRALDAGERLRIEQSVAQSAPILANLRNLAIAETRAATDALTGLPNRRAVDDTLLRLLAQAGRSFTPLSVILLDLDHFKHINDTCGHDRGDEALAGFATRLKEVLRASDFAGRSGGEEFVVFLPDTDRTGAIRLAEKLRDALRGLTVPGLERDITASFGISAFPEDGVDADVLMRCADRALYAAKRNGRDRIEASSTGAPPPLAPVAAD